MAAEDQTYRLLSELGLNEYETRAYLAVIEGGILAREVSDRASIPYAKVYQTLNDLIDKQLIMGDEGRPKKFRPRNPEEAINDRLITIDNEWQVAHEKRKGLIATILPELIKLYEATDFVEDELQGVWNITGLSNIISRLSKLAKTAKVEILVVTGDFSAFSSNLLKPIFDNTQVPVDLLTTATITDSTFRKIKTRKSIGSATIIIFDDMAMISITEIEKGKYSAGEFTAVLTQIRELVELNKTTYGGMIS